MQFKQGVKLKGVKPEVIIAIFRLDSLFKSLNIPFIITSVTDGKHFTNSLHYKGLAFDLRTKHIQDVESKKTLAKEIKAALGEEFDVVLESLGGEQEHIHVEFDPKS
jgi:hypothetical protein